MKPSKTVHVDTALSVSVGALRFSYVELLTGRGPPYRGARAQRRTSTTRRQKMRRWALRAIKDACAVQLAAHPVVSAGSITVFRDSVAVRIDTVP